MEDQKEIEKANIKNHLGYILDDLRIQCTANGMDSDVAQVMVDHFRRRFTKLATDSFTNGIRAAHSKMNAAMLEIRDLKI